MDQLQDLRKRLFQVLALEERELVLLMIMDEIIDEDGVHTPTHFTMHSGLLYKKRLILKMRDQYEAKGRKQENRKKILMQDALRNSSKQKIQRLKSRKYFCLGRWTTQGVRI